MERIQIFNVEQIDQAAQELLHKAGDKRIFAFFGAMGVGKTTLIQALCRILGVREAVNSPSFAIINEYHNQTGEMIYHFDFYRINKLEEVFDLGYEDYFYSGHYCFIEWSEHIEALLPVDHLAIKMTEKADMLRELTF